ncbi:MAG: hypothetical protein JWN74_1390 [Acidobacteriaceae bacterium]|nr:hypothetical protein [Acidobacteriaceae bacterium]
MLNRRASLKRWAHGACLALTFVFSGLAVAQTVPEPTLISYKTIASRSTVAIEPAHSSDSFLPEAPSQHKFLDGKNRLLFSTVAIFSAGDFAVTHMNLASGGRELNPIVRPFTGSTATLAANFVGQTAGVVAISYLLHKTGHHRLERMAPAVNIASSAFAVAYGLSHR